MTEHDDAQELPERAASQIDDNLKRVYQELVQEEVPDRFRQLLDQLRDAGPANDAVAEPRREAES